jgi:two-component system cell cycle response regulator
MKNLSTVLIVDDEPVGRDTLEALLVGQGHNLVFAANGAEALTQAAELLPDVILLDVMMPGMDGFEVCRRLRANPRLADVPVVMVTALDDRDSRLEGIEAGADDFVSKPFDRAELRARIKTVTRLNRYRRLHMERAKFEWVVESADDGYVLVNDRDEVLYANPRARMLLGLPAQDREPVTSTFAELAGRRYHCQSREAWFTGSEQLPLKLPCYFVQPESATLNAVWLLVDALALPSGPDSGQLYRLKDITGQMVLRRQTWTFHSMVSHKLRTPLTGMLASLEMLSDEVATMSTEEAAGLAGLAFRSVRRLCDEIEDIFRYLDAPALAHLEAGLKCSGIPALVSRISGELKLDSVTITVQDDLADGQFSLSQRAMEMTLWELLENSQKFHPRQSPAVRVSVTRSGPGQVCLQVQDNGSTLGPQQLERVWSPYYQDEKYFTGQTPGMGLGLAMVAAMVWGVGGTCCIHNREQGPGVVVELVLPLAQDAEEIRAN